MKTKRSIEIEEDPDFERYEWKIQRVCWVLMVLIMLAALLGLTGPGPLSKREVVSDNGNMRLEYDRFIHNSSPREINILLTSPPGKNEVVLKAGHSFIRDLGLERIVPEPESQEAEDEFMVYRFKKTGQQPLLLTLHINPTTVGNHEAIFSTENEKVVISQFIYP